MDSDSLFDDFLQRAAFRSTYALDRIQHSREPMFVFERRDGRNGEPGEKKCLTNYTLDDVGDVAD